MARHRAAVAAVVAVGLAIVWLSRRRKKQQEEEKKATSSKSTGGDVFKRRLQPAVSALKIAGKLGGERFTPKITPTSSDAPLQQAIAALKALGATLEAQSKAEDAAAVVTIIELLRTQHFSRRETQKTMFKALVSGGDITAEESIGLRQWVGDYDSDDMDHESKADPAARQNSQLSARLMKWTRKLPSLSLQPSTTSSLARLLEHDVLKWDLDVNELQALSGNHALVALGWAVIEWHGLRAKLGLHTNAVLDFLVTVERGYRDVAYHNSIHAADVTHAMHWLMSSDSLSPLVEEDPLLLFTSLLSAIVHDLGHDGFNNAYHINSNSDIAVKACYAAPLERHHLSSAFALLARKDGILSGFDLVDRKQLQTWMRELVLATDFGAHHAVISEFKTMLDLRGVVGDASGAPVAVDRRMSSESLRIASRSFEGDEKILALKMAIKTADLGYLTKGEKACHVWTERVLQEFFTQGDTEKQLNLPVSYGCDREAVDVPALQLGFYKAMITPLYDAMDLLVPMEEQLSNLDDMFRFWQAKKDAAASASS